MGWGENSFQFSVNCRTRSPVGGATGVQYTRRSVGGSVGWTLGPAIRRGRLHFVFVTLSGSPSFFFSTLPVSTTHVLDFDRRPAILARRSQVAVFLQRQLRVRSFFSFAGQVLGNSASNDRPSRASPARAMPWAQTNSLRSSAPRTQSTRHLQINPAPVSGRRSGLRSAPDPLTLERSFLRCQRRLGLRESSTHGSL